MKHQMPFWVDKWKWTRKGAQHNCLGKKYEIERDITGFARLNSSIICIDY